MSWANTAARAHVPPTEAHHAVPGYGRCRPSSGIRGFPARLDVDAEDVELGDIRRLCGGGRVVRPCTGNQGRKLLCVHNVQFDHSRGVKSCGDDKQRGSEHACTARIYSVSNIVGESCFESLKLLLFFSWGSAEFPFGRSTRRRRLRPWVWRQSPRTSSKRSPPSPERTERRAVADFFLS